MRLRRHIPKINGTGAHREVSSEVTWDRVRPHLRRAGITRVADITWLDRVGIPVYNAISPRSHDVISVYNGKGARPIDAMTSAVMEGIERFSAWLPVRPAAIASYEELSAQGRPVLNPRDYNLKLSRHYRDDAPISWVEGFDLLNEESVLVPQDGAVYNMKMHEPPTYEISTTNGLASGNSLEEAICHALCEVIERDSITIAELLSSQLSQVLEKGLHVERQPAAIFERLKELHPHLDMESLPPRVQALVQQFHTAGIEMRLINITTDLGVASFMAATAEDLGPTVSQGHGGFGTHPDAEVALLRAISECAQGRAVDIQAMREDISLPGEDVPRHLYHVRRSSTLDKGGWAWRPVGARVRMSDIPSRPSEDIIADIEFMLGRLRSCGIRRAVVVDLSPPGIPVNVVRLLVPHLESWGVDYSKLGERGAGAWTRALNELAEKKRDLAVTV
ncbi:YcaO-like family protein [Microbispora sp. NPDC049633]|uniref:YcaO-like family protein n=1 Tax=Microbispora sp. NPDC049633 TaxID=3154355 RepID=UPI00342E6FE6